MDLPEKAKEYISNKYNGHIASNVLFLDNNESIETDMILYNTQFSPEDYYFVELSNGFEGIVLQITNNYEWRCNYFGRVF